jgi:uncharacterized protein (TIGR04255 family)
MPDQLPEFENPPLDEVAIGVQYEPIRGFHVSHMGLYWDRIRESYPYTEDQPALAQQKEPESLSPPFGFSFALPLPRCWFLDAAKHELIQLQSDRFLRNWRSLDGSGPYPRFGHLIEKYRREWNGFLEFLKDERLTAPTVNQCELTYVNNFEAEGGWKDYSSLGKTFSIIRDQGPNRFLPPPEIFSWETRYKLPSNQGRLHIQMQPVFRGQDFKLSLAFNLTARGSPASKGEGIFDWFSLAHEWIVRAFDELTEPAMHAVWKKKT